MGLPNIERLTRQFVLLITAGAAFRKALEASAFLRRNTQPFCPGGNLYSTMCAGIVVTYAQNFCAGNGNSDLPQNYAKFDDPFLEGIHKELIKQRHEIYAHRDVEAAAKWAEEKGQRAPYSSEISFLEENCFVSNTPMLDLSPIMLPGIVGLCGFQLQRIETDMKKMMPVLSIRKPYPLKTLLKVGVDFP